MHSKHYLRAQTELIDSFLSELSQAGSEPAVNFNNTKQFDTLLRHLELSLHTAPFSSAPSVAVVHILFTLSARCHASFWSHESLRSPVVEDTSDYMRQVNMEYDSTLFKPSLQQRSTEVLRTYVQLAGTGSGAAVERLRANLQEAFSSLLRSDITQLLTRPKVTVADAAVVSPVSIEPPVEVISDSEESDSLLEMSTADDPLKPLDPATVTSFFDLGSKTSGLGDTAMLFKEMPHLSSQVTPEPDAPPKTQNKASALCKLQVFDDYLLFQKLQVPASYDMWSLYKWMCWCANTSSQYQAFLFNSASTTVHSIYKSYESFFSVLLAYCRSQFLRKEHRRNILIPQLLQLRAGSFERVVEHIFCGLGVGSNEKPFPCFNRETILMKQDPATQVSRCKETVMFDDNESSIVLRLRFLELLFYYDYIYKAEQNGSQFHCEKWPTKDEALLAHTAAKVGDLPPRYFRSFFRIFSSQGDHLNSDFMWEVMKRVSMRLLWNLTSYLPLKRAGSSSLDDFVTLIKEPQLYTGITEDSTLKSWEDFEDKWTRLQFLLEWHLAAFQVGKLPYKEAVHGARAAEKTMASCYNEFLSRRSEDADVIEDTSFTLSAAEVERHREGFQCSFEEIVHMLY